MEAKNRTRRKKECKHTHYEIKIVMDMAFCVCKECGFQWKGREPYNKIGE